jgi:hypothetical protein
MLFPYVSSGSSAYTFLTVHNGGSNQNARAAAGTAFQAHYIYAMKAVGAANSNGCEHQNGTGTLTANDVTQFEMGGKVNVATSLANGDTAVGNGALWTGGADRIGFMMVNTNGWSSDEIFGSAVVVDTASGLRMAYSTQGLNTNSAVDPDWTVDNTGAAGGPEPVVGLASGVLSATAGAGATAVGSANQMTSWYASPSVSTSWYVIPLGRETNMMPAGSVGGIFGAYTMSNRELTIPGAYDMNEQFTSGSLTTTVRCQGTITRETMLQGGAITNTAKGGMGVLNVLVPTTAQVAAATAGSPLATGFGGGSGAGTTANKSLVFKIQTTSVINGAANTFVTREQHR